MVLVGRGLGCDDGLPDVLEVLCLFGVRLANHLND